MLQDRPFLINLLNSTVIYTLEDTWSYCVCMVEAPHNVICWASLPKSAFCGVHLVTWNQVNDEPGHFHFFPWSFRYVKKDEWPK